MPKFGEHRETTVQRIKIVGDALSRKKLAEASGVNEWNVRSIQEGKTWTRLGKEQALCVDVSENYKPRTKALIY